MGSSRPALPRLILLVLGLALSARPAEFIAITEILKDPVGNEDAIPGGKSHEFIEFTNLGADTFSIDSLYLSNGVKVDSVMPWPGPMPFHPRCLTGLTTIPPGRSALILDPDYAKAPASSAFTIDSGAVLLTVDHTSLVDGLSATSGVFLFKGARDHIARIVASAVDKGQVPALTNVTVRQSSVTPIPEGVSVVPAHLLLDPSLWEASPETVSPGHYEFVKDSWLVDWRLGSVDTTANSVVCSLTCLRVGETSPSAPQWSITASGGRAIQPAVALPTIDGLAMLSASLPLDTVVYQFIITQGARRTAWDLDLTNAWTPLNCVKITEIFPRGGSGSPEWFEIANTSAIPISLADWTYGNSEKADPLVSQATVVPPGTFLVVTADVGAFLRSNRALTGRCVQPPVWHALNNYNDTLILWDNRGNLVDRVWYSSSWFTGWDAQSLERVSTDIDGTNPSAWALASAPTPGQPNGSVTWRSSDRATMDIGPLPFTPNGDRVDDVLSIRVTLPATASMAVSILGFDGSTIRTMPAATQSQAFWDGRTDGGAHAPVGPFFVVAEIKDGVKSYRIRKKGVLWR